MTELPYQVNKASLLEKIAELVKDKQIDGIADMRDESDRDGMRDRHRAQARRQPAHGPEQPVQAHRAADSLQHEHARARRRPAPDAAAKQRAQHYIAHRREVIRRRTEFDLAKARDRAHILEGLKIALDNLDAVIKTIRASADVDAPRTNLMTRFDLSERQAQAILDMRLRPPGRARAQEDRGRVPRDHPADRRARGHPRQPGPRAGRSSRTSCRAQEASYAGERRTRVADDSSRELTDEDLIANEDVVVTISRSRLHQAPAGRDVPPPAPRRQGHHRPRHPRGGRGRAPARREHPRLGAVLHEPRPRLHRPRSTLSPTPVAPGQGPADHQPAGHPGRGAARCRSRRSRCPSSSPGSYLVLATRQGDHQEDAARAVRAGPLDRDPGDHPRRGRRARLGRRLLGRGRHHHRHRPGHARPVQRERGPGHGPRRRRRDRHPAAQEAGRRGRRMSVVQPGADLLVLTETGYGKRVPIDEFRKQAPRRPGRAADLARGPQDRRRGRGPAGHRARRGARPDLGAGGQVVRTDLDTVNRYSPQARGVIVMRLNEGDRVVGIAAFRAGVGRRARRRATMASPDAGPGTGGSPPGGQP